MPGGAVAMAEGNALGKGPVIFHLFDSGIELIRRKAAGGPVYAPPPPITVMHACTHKRPSQATQIDTQMLL